MESVHIPPQEQARGGSMVAVYLSLFLVVLAFFILLVTISSVEQVKSNAVMDSLTSTFTSALPPSTDLPPFAAKEGDVIAGHLDTSNNRTVQRCIGWFVRFLVA